MAVQVQITDSLYRYILNHSLREPPLLAELRAATLQTPHAQMLSAADEVQFIVMLQKLIQAKKIIEVGVFTGYTTLAMAMHLPKDGRLAACDISAEWVQIGRPFWQQAGVEALIDFRLGPAHDSLEHLITTEAGSFDLIYIDADKQGYAGYYEQSLRLIRQGGLILLDNLLQKGRVADLTNQNPSVVHIRELTQRLHTDPRIDFSLLPLADGLGICVRRN